ncbi:MAG TPA: 2,5-diamino-6-(ribosylamino)-4(3H)-pyrimidinone 5'-phosphate reductase [Methanomassiliicoccales archaeon]|jgi:2,5-diamino-6-(ribosylamino)-4(3H)-pyrimidinone 5'-phosphate reductase|nr:2,5-diamino-6-(ribosylamino)-4(3H)-pyrimidinone 5'-phosphate reductase [Methanomassiliicoccales archaeon]
MPHVIVNCAMTADGKIAGRERRQVRISSPEDLERVRALRGQVDAVLVGVGTVLADDPHLTVKGAPPEKNPTRIVLDSRGRTPDGARVLDGEARTIIVTASGCSRTWPNAETLCLGDGRVDLRLLMEELDSRGIRRLLVEGGGETIYSFFAEDLVDEYKVFVGSMVIGGREAPTPADGEGFDESRCRRLRLIDTERLGSGVLLSYEVTR